MHHGGCEVRKSMNHPLSTEIKPRKHIGYIRTLWCTSGRQSKYNDLLPISTTDSWLEVNVETPVLIW